MGNFGKTNRAGRLDRPGIVWLHKNRCGLGRGGLATLCRGGFGLLGLVAAATLLQGAGGELMLALVALAAEAGGPTRGALRGRLFRQQLKQDDVPAVADA